MTGKKSINFTVVPDESEDPEGKTSTGSVYANFCAVDHTPFDFTLTFCQMKPLSEKDVEGAPPPEGETRIVRAPVKVKVVVPAQLIPALGAALQEKWRTYQDAYSSAGWGKGKMGGKVH
ncbi:MAG: hypothetical protein BMS9Abin37_3312 [Acidobacteriota bacterium]|nr:MAG: hypothetical protein BMS9Abin37_3312 [Acidobacteriota bacterium]